MKSVRSWKTRGGRSFKLGDRVRRRFDMDWNFCGHRIGTIVSSTERNRHTKVVVQWDNMVGARIETLRMIELVLSEDRIGIGA